MLLYFNVGLKIERIQIHFPSKRIHTYIARLVGSGFKISCRVASNDVDVGVVSVARRGVEPRRRGVATLQSAGTYRATFPCLAEKSIPLRYAVPRRIKKEIVEIVK